jgi:superfamily I DNA/RNA helicase
MGEAKMRVVFTGCPGTGKTFSMVKSIKEMVDNKEIDNFIILTPTRASREAVLGIMSDLDFLDEDKVRTIHSFAFRYLSSYDVWTSSEDEEFYKKFKLKFYPNLMVDFSIMPLGNKIDYIRRFVINETNTTIDKLKTNDAIKIISRVSREIQITIKEEKIYEILIEREREKEKKGMIDYDDMILKSEVYTQDYDLIAVDESQLSTKFMLNFIRKLSRANNFFATNDPTQAIAPLSPSQEELINFIKSFDKIEILKENKRMSKNIVEYVNKVYSKIKPIWENTYSNIEGGEVRLISEKDLGRVINLADILITFSNDAIKRIENLLIEAGVPFIVKSGLERVYGSLWNEEKLKLREALIRFSKGNSNYDDLSIIAKYMGKSYTYLELEKIKQFSLREILNTIKSNNFTFGYALERSLNNNKPIIISTVQSSQGLTFDSILVYPKVTKYLKRTLDLYSAITWYGVAITRGRGRLFILTSQDTMVV